MDGTSLGPAAGVTSMCAGDCTGTHAVAVNDIIILVNVVLGTAQASVCPDGIPSGSQVSVSLIIQAVNNVLKGCPAT